MEKRAVAALAALLVGAAPAYAHGDARNAGITWSNAGTIMLANVDGSGRRVLADDSDGAGDPSWTRDGRGLAFYRKYSDDSRLNVDWPATNRGDELWSRSAYRSYQPTWSPDAKRIAVTEFWDPAGRFSSTQATIKTVSLSTHRWALVTKPRRYQLDSEPAWSPDGRTIAFTRERSAPPGQLGGAPVLYLVRPDGHALRRLTPGRSPTWSPDGNRLAFVLGRSIYEIRADGSGRQRIVGGLRDRGFQPPFVRWSPDGAKLLYTSGAYAWVMDAHGTHRKRVLHERYGFEGIAWRPGGP